MYFYSYVYVSLLLCVFCSVCSFSLCCSVYCLYVNVYCTTATGCQSNRSKQIYHSIYLMIYFSVRTCKLFISCSRADSVTLGQIFTPPRTISSFHCLYHATNAEQPLAAYSKLHPATISFVMSVCPSVRMEQLGSQ